MSETLMQSLQAFGQRYNRDARLQKMTADWDRVIAVEPVDEGTAHTLEVRGGRMQVRPGAPEEADIVVRAPLSVLCGIFTGQMSPTEPYMDGRLMVRGSQEDVLRLDMLSLLIWGD